MKLFTRCFSTLTAVLLPLASAFATTFTVNIGNNFYSPATLAIKTGDIVHFVLQAGTHPTQSDTPTPAWQTFTLSSTTPTRDITFNSVGSFPYHCQAHAQLDPATNNYVGQTGLITVTAIASAALDPRLAAAVLTVYPNPSRGQVTVQLNQKPGADYKLRLSNIIGQEIRTVALRPELTPAGLPLDLSDLRAGLYFYSLLVDGKVVTTKRLVLQN